MATRRRNHDRRHWPRFEVVGDLLGTLELLQPLSVANISSGGALIESDRPWPLGSMHSIVLANGSEVGEACIRVRHVTRSVQADGVFLIGVEFLTISPVLADEITRWLAASGEGMAES